MNSNISHSFTDTKKHYIILDGLRGVAAVIVVMFHLLETFAGGDHVKQLINHGYLAVDFFFLLSGFVIGYAYDDRWHKMSLKEFFKRRLIRLHPMIIVGMVIGAITFYQQANPMWPGIADVSLLKMLAVMLIGFTLLPVPKSMDIRGWGEMHPLNGPAWSLFFEYIANILYALILRKVSNKVLFLLVLISGGALIHLAVTSSHGDIIGGWSIDSTQLRIGFTRLLYPFLAGLFLSRTVKPGSIKNAFMWSCLILVAILSIPRVGGHDHLWMNGLYDSLSIIFVFPLVVFIGASGQVESKIPSTICKFLGDISYPLYIIHYPLTYVFMAWVANNKVSMAASIPVALTILIGSIILAYICFKLYDVPVRKWLTKRTMARASK
ncbi:acyltransferase [Limibacter armeniacum]|uniref:acyltransferase family protein n=1 Tax=Limibacter armeniacum TaxID=466084 RepID=UPI002FE5F979